MPYKDPQKQKEAQAKHYQEKKDRYKKQLHNRRIQRAKWFHDHKSQDHIKCEKCGEGHPSCLSYHHIEPKTKFKSGKHVNCISDMVTFAYSEKKILKEMEKCQILCRNCHAKHHYNEDDRLRDRDLHDI